MRRLALYSDDRLRVAYPDGPTRALEMMAKSPLPLSEAERVALVSVDDVRQLADGRVSALVTVDNPASHSHDPQTAATASQQEVARLDLCPGGWTLAGRRDPQRGYANECDPRRGTKRVLSKRANVVPSNESRAGRNARLPRSKRRDASD